MAGTLSTAAFVALVGQEVAVSDWILVDQSRIDAFAGATEDRQFIHVDPARAAQTPFASTIAHGFLTLSLIAGLADLCVPRLTDEKFGINYGLNRLRFISPVRAGRRVRARFLLKEAEPAPGFLAITYAVTVDIEGEDKPALATEWLLRTYL